MSSMFRPVAWLAQRHTVGNVEAQRRVCSPALDMVRVKLTADLPTPLAGVAITAVHRVAPLAILPGTPARLVRTALHLAVAARRTEHGGVAAAGWAGIEGDAATGTHAGTPGALAQSHAPLRAIPHIAALDQRWLADEIAATDNTPHGDRGGACSPGTSPRAVATLACLDDGRENLEQRATVFAHARRFWTILTGHLLTSITGRRGHAPGVSQALAGASCCPNYTIGRP